MLLRPVMAQAISHRLFTAEARIRSVSSPCVCCPSASVSLVSTIYRCSTLVFMLLLPEGQLIRRWVKNYPHYRYMFCCWQYCWLVMTKYTWSTPLLPLWCGCDLDSPFLSWVFSHKHGHSQFHLHQRRAESSDPFLWAEGVPGVEMHRMMSVQYGNSVMSQRIVC